MFNFLLITFIPNSPTLFLSKVRQTNPGSVCTSLLDNVTILQLIFAILVEYPTFFPTYRIQFDYYVTDLAPIYLKIPSYSFLIVYEDVSGRLGASVELHLYFNLWNTKTIEILGRRIHSSPPAGHVSSLRFGAPATTCSGIKTSPVPNFYYIHCTPQQSRSWCRRL